MRRAAYEKDVGHTSVMYSKCKQRTTKILHVKTRWQEKNRSSKKRHLEEHSPEKTQQEA